MASILYAWEFGANLGHVGAFMPLACSLRDEGHEVHWAVTQPASVGDFLAAQGFACVAAPVIPEMQRNGPPLSYADILLRYGYSDAKSLFGLVGAWRELMRLTGARVVMADHAPTAVLAARTLGLPVMLFSNGFTVPPRLSPLPNMRPWTEVSTQVLVDLDRAALSNVNIVMKRFGLPPMAHLANLFDVAEESLVSFPELDHYSDRGPARYWGSLPSAGGGAKLDWPQGKARIFAYLRAEVVHAEAVLAALHALGHSTLVYFPELPPQFAQRFSAPHLRFSARPADIEQMTCEADLAVTYSSLATTTAFLLAGKPLLLLPTHLEQYLVARRVVEMGAGAVISPEGSVGDPAAILTTLLDTPSYRENAQAFAAKYAKFDQLAVIGNLVRRVNEVIAQ
jgi:UDP:flavonoid glycosyltransferase YjiC (YdhE family)